MVLEYLKHLKPLSIKSGPCILEEETSWSVLNGSPKLTFPKLACQRVSFISQKQIILTGRRETRGAKPEQEDIASLKVIIR